MCQGPTDSILVLSRKGSKFLLSKLKLEKEQCKLRSDESEHVENELLQMCCTGDVLMALYGNKEYVQAVKLGDHSLVWKLSGVVEAHAIQPDALTCDKKGNVYVSEGVNNRILKIDGVTGNVVNFLLLETKNEEIRSLLWSDIEPNLTVVHGNRMTTYNVPQLS